MLAKILQQKSFPLNFEEYYVDSMSWSNVARNTKSLLHLMTWPGKKSRDAWKNKELSCYCACLTATTACIRDLASWA